MNTKLECVKVDMTRLLDYTTIAEERTQIKADVKISKAVCDLLLQDIYNKDTYLVDILKAYELQLSLLCQEKLAFNAFEIAFAVLVKGVPLVLIGMLDINRDNDFWPTLVIRLSV